MREFRITKYDPLKRDLNGAYLDHEEWTSFSEIGKKLTKEDYEKVKTAYIQSALDLVSGTVEKELIVDGLEDYKNISGLTEGDTIKGKEIEGTLRSILRDEYWCLLKSESAFVHIGYDYYMYVGVIEVNKSTLKNIENRGLYVENFISPFHPEQC